MSEKNTILRSTTAVAAVMLCSKLLGFLRQTVIAGTFGSNVGTDIYFISSEFMVNVSAAFTTALTTALVTVYIAVAAKEGRRAAGGLASKVLTMFLLGASAAVVVLDLFAGQVGRLLAPAYDAAQLASLAHYLRLFSAAFLFSAFQSIYAAVLNANDIFIPGKLYGVVFNPIAILAVLLLGDWLGISALVYAYYAANLLQVLFLHLRCRSLYSFRPALQIRDSRLLQVGRLALPMLISNVVIQLNQVVDKAICSYLGEGVASAYTYAYTLEQFVTGTFTATITMILLSRFASLAAQGDGEGLTATLGRAVGSMVLVLAPIALITVLSAGDITALIYLRGQFTAHDAQVTALALIGFALGFPLVALREIFIRVHFAYQKTQLPMVISILSVFLNVGLSVLLARPMGILGVTAATSISALLAVVLLTCSTKRDLPRFRFLSLWPTYLKCAAALCVSAAAVLLCGGIGSLLLRTMARLALGCAAYAGALLALRCEELGWLLRSVTERVRRKGA